MIIREDFDLNSSLPPRMFMQQIMDDLSKTYCFLWDRKDESNKLTMNWKDIAKYYNKNTFKTKLRKLNNEGLLSYEEYLEGIKIELVPWDESFM